MKRPELTRHISLKDFQEYYWLKKELLDFCRQIGICASGGKLELARRIEIFLERGEIITKADIPKSRPKSNFDWRYAELSPATIITDNYTNCQNVRAFFLEAIGRHFSFNTTFMNWMQENPGKTLGEAVEEWKRIAEMKKAPTHQSEIAPQFEYNRYIRDFLVDNPDLSAKDATKRWKLKREKPGPHRYESTDVSDD